MIRKTCRLLFCLAGERGAVTVESLVEAAQPLVDKPIRLRPTSFSGTETFGMSLALPQANVILFEESTSPMHRSHIIQHELGHIVLGHRGMLVRHEGQGGDGRLARTLQHDDFESQEAEAEVFAIRMTGLLHREATKESSAPDSGVARRIAMTLEGGRRLSGF